MSQSRPNFFQPTNESKAKKVGICSESSLNSGSASTLNATAKPKLLKPARYLSAAYSLSKIEDKNDAFYVKDIIYSILKNIFKDNTSDSAKNIIYFRNNVSEIDLKSGKLNFQIECCEKDLAKNIIKKFQECFKVIVEMTSTEYSAEMNISFNEVYKLYNLEIVKDKELQHQKKIGEELDLARRINLFSQMENSVKKVGHELEPSTVFMGLKKGGYKS